MKKKCNKCGKTKLVKEFYANKANKDGLKNICIVCDKERGQIYRDRLKNRDVIPQVKLKVCCKCGKKKRISQFYKDKRRKDGHNQPCKVCHKLCTKQCYIRALEKDPNYNKKSWQRQMSKPGAREKHRDRSKRYHHENKNKHNASIKRWSDKNREYQRQLVKDWYKTDNGRRHIKKRRANRRVNRKEWIATEIVRLVEQANVKKYGVLTCIYCEVPIGKTYHLDHKIPLIKGGANKKVNLCIACPECNLSKGTLTATEYRKRLKVV